MFDMDNEPDIDWTCVIFNGTPFLVLQATGPALSAVLLAREYKTIETRFIFDNDKLPDLVPDKFICFTDGEIMAPVLACDPDPMLHPLRVAITEKKPWLFAVQVMVGGSRHMRWFLVNPDNTTEIIPGPNGESVIERWVVGIVD